MSICKPVRIYSALSRAIHRTLPRTLLRRVLSGR